MTDVRGVEPDHKQAKLRQRQPHWHLSPQYAAFAIRIVLVRTPAAGTFAGDDKHGANTIGLSTAQEPQQLAMGLRLRHDMQIETRFDRLASARNTLLQPPVERRKGWRFWRSRDMRRDMGYDTGGLPARLWRWQLRRLFR